MLHQDISENRTSISILMLEFGRMTVLLNFLLILVHRSMAGFLPALQFFPAFFLKRLWYWSSLPPYYSTDLLTQSWSRISSPNEAWDTALNTGNELQWSCFNLTTLWGGKWKSALYQWQPKPDCCCFSTTLWYTLGSTLQKELPCLDYRTVPPTELLLMFFLYCFSSPMLKIFYLCRLAVHNCQERILNAQRKTQP